MGANDHAYINRETKKIRSAKWFEDNQYWGCCVGKRGGDFRRYHTLDAMDKAMAKIGFERMVKRTK